MSEERPAAIAGARPTPATSPGDDTILAHGAAEVRLAQELRLHRIELEAQHEELRSTKDELEAARDRFADLYELSPVAQLTTTASGVVLELNGAAPGSSSARARAPWASPSPSWRASAPRRSTLTCPPASPRPSR